MSFAASLITVDSAYLLDDPNGVRWTEAELLGYLTDALEALAAYRPEAFGGELVHNLEAGSEQSLPSNVAVVFDISYNTNQA